MEAPHWSADQLEEDRQTAIGLFRTERLQEPIETYTSALDDYQGVVADLLEQTVDLSELSDEALIDILADESKLLAFRYLPGPPISLDDLATLAEAPLLKRKVRKKLVEDSESVLRITRVVMDCVDRRRFPWVTEQREPSEAERNAAVLASAALMAYQRVQTWRRTEAKDAQEDLVKEALLSIDLQEVPARKIPTMQDAPKDGEFCPESVLGKRKADFVVGLWDHRKAAIECKVSNSEINSVKRLNNDAAAKAVAWVGDFGTRQVVPIAVLSGVFKLANLEDAQARGLSLIWAHNLDALTGWIKGTRP